jgi:hypothetical protein
VIVGIRPEHLEDAAQIDTYARIRALTFEVTVDFVESLGADKYMHFKTEGAGAHAAQLAELAADSGVDENEFVARVSTASTAAQGQTMELAFDTTKIAIFDGDTGANLTIPPTSGSREEQTATSGSREEQTAASGSREEQTAASGSREEQTAASGSREEQTAASDSTEPPQAPPGEPTPPPAV